VNYCWSKDTTGLRGEGLNNSNHKFESAMFIDQLSASPRHRLNQVLHTLKHVHACELPVHDLNQLQECAREAHEDRARIVEQHEFNSYMQQPAYVKANLILEAVKMLTEVAPKRRKRVQEHKESSMRILNEAKAKPDFLDIDRDGDRKESMKKAIADKKKVAEANKPDFLDLDKDGDKKEPIKQAAKQAKQKGHTQKESVLKEDANLDKAQTLLAAKDISDRLQGMAEDAAKMAVDDLMPLVDTMKDQFGLEAATAFNNVVKQQLQTVLDSIIAAKDQTDNAINTMETGGMPEAPADISQPLPPMSGTTPAAPEQAPEGEPEADMSAAPAPEGGEGDIDLEKEFAATPATSGPEEEPLGRSKKEVAEATLTPAQQKAQQELAKTAAEQMVKTRKKADGTMATAQEIADAKKLMTEKLTKNMSAGEVISDFVHSDDPKFRGKSKAERKKMALGAYYGMHPEKKLKESRHQVMQFKQRVDQAVAQYQAHVSSLKESWIQQQGDLRSAVLQAQVTHAREQLQEAIAEYKQHKQEWAQHVHMQEMVKTKLRKLDEQIARTPFGVKVELNSGKQLRKFFESAEMRDTWVRYNHAHIQQVQFLDVMEMQQLRDRLLRLI
jgi:hypothetical protein